MTKDILWLIARPKETIKIIFKLNLIERFIFKWAMKKKRIDVLKNTTKIKGKTFKYVIIDEFA